MKCNYCGFDCHDGDKYCRNCSKELAVKPYDSYRSVKNNHSAVIITIILSMFVFTMILATLCVAGYIINNKNQDDDTSENNISSSAQVTPDPGNYSRSSQTTPAQPVLFERDCTYSPAFSYKNMPEIHKATPAPDSICFELQDFIYIYNDAWIEYINNADNTIYTYLRKNTRAYEYTVKYGRKSISESFELIDVNDVMEYQGTYYVWVHERINEYSKSGTKKLEYHWVYKIGQDTRGFYVENYTADPFYK